MSHPPKRVKHQYQSSPFSLDLDIRQLQQKAAPLAPQAAVLAALKGGPQAAPFTPFLVPPRTPRPSDPLNDPPSFWAFKHELAAFGPAPLLACGVAAGRGYGYAAPDSFVRDAAAFALVRASQEANRAPSFPGAAWTPGALDSLLASMQAPAASCDSPCAALFPELPPQCYGVAGAHPAPVVTDWPSFGSDLAGDDLLDRVVDVCSQELVNGEEPGTRLSADPILRELGWGAHPRGESPPDIRPAPAGDDRERAPRPCLPRSPSPSPKRKAPTPRKATQGDDAPKRTAPRSAGEDQSDKRASLPGAATSTDAANIMCGFTAALQLRHALQPTWPSGVRVTPRGLELGRCNRFTDEQVDLLKTMLMSRNVYLKPPRMAKVHKGAGKPGATAGDFWACVAMQDFLYAAPSAVEITGMDGRTYTFDCMRDRYLKSFLRVGRGATVETKQRVQHMRHVYGLPHEYELIRNPWSGEWEDAVDVMMEELIRSWPVQTQGTARPSIVIYPMPDRSKNVPRGRDGLSVHGPPFASRLMWGHSGKVTSEWPGGRAYVQPKNPHSQAAAFVRIIREACALCHHFWYPDHFSPDAEVCYCRNSRYMVAAKPRPYAPFAVNDPAVVPADVYMALLKRIDEGAFDA
ncbi:unnamed protein product [Pedinophyceae sp. YPF-701]|nr:unnamed protein product [Pedinophyceae sp. YPF-701]